MVPQFDCLWEHLTGREHLRLYARICGTYYKRNLHAEPPVVVSGAIAQHQSVGPTASLISTEAPSSATTEASPHSSTSSLPSASSWRSSPGAAPPFGEELISSLLHGVGLSSEEGDKQSRTYSGGMKRKLSLAICLISSPTLLYLDEPSTGVDAAAKRVLWKTISGRSEAQTVLLTTHSMEEADALCDRVGILVGGCLKCLGSAQHIKSKYGNGYQLELLLKVVRTEGPANTSTEISFEEFAAVERRIVGELSELTGGFSPSEKSEAATALPPRGGTVLVEVLESTRVAEDRWKLTLALPKQKLGSVFRWCCRASDQARGLMEESGTCVFLEDYALGQPTLEQVFLKFAREQEGFGEEEGGVADGGGANELAA